MNDVTGPSEGALAAAYDEARRGLDRQLSMLADLDNKASEIFKFNALVVGLILAGMSMLVRSGPAVVPSGSASLVLVVIGVAGMGTSTVFAVMAYRATRVTVGIGPGTIDALLASESTSTEFITHVVEAYGRATRGTLDVSARVIARLDLALAFLLLGLGSVLAAPIVLFALGWH